MGEQTKNQMVLIDDGFDYVLLGASRLHGSMRQRALDDHAQAMTRITATEQEAMRQATAAYMTTVREAVAAANDVRTAALAAAHETAQSEREQADQARADLLRHADGIVLDASDQIETIRNRLSAKLTELAMQNPEMVALLDEALAEMGMPVEVVPLSAVPDSGEPAAAGAE
jgi:hypothetical protein